MLASREPLYSGGLAERTGIGSGGLVCGQYRPLKAARWTEAEDCSESLADDRLNGDGGHYRSFNCMQSPALRCTF